jgi:diguanylate cyclase
VLNRRSLLHIVGDERARTDRSGSPTSVAIFDLDHFKMLNDTYGHLAGDRALRLFADEVSKLTRSTDRFGRYGGEEFLMVLTDTDVEKAEIAVERIRTGLTKVEWGTVAPGIGVTFSAGIATYRPGESTEQLLARADLGLYGAKHAGRNCTRAG